jgi:hypothetical protein
MKRGTGWTLAALAAMAAAMVGWVASSGAHHAPDSDRSPAAEASMPAPSQATDAMPVRAATASSKAPLVRADASAELPPGHVAVCHGAPVRLERPDAELDRELEREVIPPLQQALAGLTVHPEPRMRAAGQMLALHLAYTEGVVAAQSGACRDGAPCPKAWEADLQANTERAVQRHLNLLVRLALDSRDAVVYGIAVQACTTHFLGSDSDACRQISVAEWARQEPDNRQVWWRVAAEAESRGDTQARDAALANAAAAPRDDSHLGAVVAAAFAAVPESTNGMLQSTLVMLVSGAWTTSMITTPPVLGLCKAEYLGNANTRQQCERLAEVLTRHPATLLDLGVGKALGRRLGWPAERLPDTNGRSMQHAEALRLLVTPEDDPMSCRTVAHQRRWLADLARVGEIGAADLLVERSGTDPESLRRRGEARRAAAVDAVQAAASAAAASAAASARTQ